MKFFIGILAILLTNQIYSQIEKSDQFKIVQSNPFIESGNTTVYYKTSDNTLVSYDRTKKNGFLFQKFEGATLNLTKSLTLSDLPAGSHLEFHLQIQDKIYIFYSIHNKSTAETKLYARELDYESGKFEKDKLLLDVQQETRVEFSLITDWQKSNFLITYGLWAGDKPQPDYKNKHGYHLFTKDLRPIWDDIITMPYAYTIMNNSGICIDNESNLYILLEVFKDGTKNRVNEDGAYNYYLELIRIDRDDQSFSETKIELNDKYLRGYSFFGGMNNEINITGYYSDNSKQASCGFYNCKIDKNGQAGDFTTVEFDVEILKRFESASKAAGYDRLEDKEAFGVPNLILRDKILHADGSYSIVGEVYLRSQHVDPKTNVSTYTYFYEEIIVCNFSPEDQMKWMQKVPKQQVGSYGQGSMGYKLITNDEYLYFIYIDDFKNELATQDSPTLRYNDGTRGVVTAMQVSLDGGKLKRMSLFNNKDFNGLKISGFYTSRILQLNNNEIAFAVHKGKKEDIMLRIKLGN